MEDFLCLYARWILAFTSGFVLEFMANKPCKKESLTGCQET